MPQEGQLLPVKLLGDVDSGELTRLLSRFGLPLVETLAGEEIRRSYWGGSEAGLVGSEVHVRADTPVHSILHEASHYVCMCASRRESLLRDAGGDDAEESAVCCLQILLADFLPGTSRGRMFLDMDQWGYSFRRGARRKPGSRATPRTPAPGSSRTISSTRAAGPCGNSGRDPAIMNEPQISNFHFQRGAPWTARSRWA